MIYKYLLLCFFAFSVTAEEIEIRLKTESNVKPIYVAKTYLDAEETNHSYYEDLRAILESDLNLGGVVSVLPIHPAWEGALHMADVKRHFNLKLWRLEKLPYIICSTAKQKVIHFTVFDVNKESSKVYEPVLMTGYLQEDRKLIHRFADQVHRDLFGVEGISSYRLIYSQREKKNDEEWRSEIFISDFDGANSEQATFENDYCITPTFLPHSAGLPDPTFIFVSYKTGQSKIYRSTLKGKKSEEVMDLGGSQLLPSLNARASQIAFITDVAGRPDLFIQNFDAVGRLVGKPKQLFSAPRATQASSTFSPDGKRIAFVSDKDGPPRIYLMDLQKKTKNRPLMITKRNRENTSPSWSADGKKIAYSSKVNGIRQIWVYDFETEEETALTTGPFNKENPSWAPDSFHLIYNTDDAEMGELFLINLNQKIPVQISKSGAQKRFAAWETK